MTIEKLISRFSGEMVRVYREGRPFDGELAAIHMDADFMDDDSSREAFAHYLGTDVASFDFDDDGALMIFVF